jgi:DNA-binding response OmpR family regulator
MSELRRAITNRILVIEHDGALQKILQRLFASEGYEVEVVSGSVAGLEILRQKPPSAVVLDLPYPAASGCDLCRKIVRLIAGLPFVILCASADVADRVLLMATGADDYVTIPFSPKQLVTRLRALMSGKSRDYLADTDYTTAEPNRMPCRSASAAVSARCSPAGCLTCSAAAPLPDQLPASFGGTAYATSSCARLFAPETKHPFAVTRTDASLQERVNNAVHHLCEIAE